MILKLPDATRLLIDASSIIRATCYAGKDVEFGKTIFFEGKQRFINSAEHGFNIFAASYAQMLEKTGTQPYQTILVLDGKDPSRFRKQLYPGYKGTRKALPQEQYDAFNDAIEGAAQELTRLGALVVQQDYTEADDVIAFLCQKLRGRKLIWSRDKDFLALQSDEVDVYLNDALNPQINPACPNSHVLVYKALVGDQSDGLPGAKSFGDKAFMDFVLRYGLEGLDDIALMIEKYELDQLDVDDFKPLKKVVEGASGVYLSYACAKFYPENVDLPGTPLKVRANITMAADDDTPIQLRGYAGTKTLIKTEAEFARAVQHIKESPFVALDIETSTPEESDRWVAAIQASKKGSKKGSFVDVFGSFLVGMSITCGRNVRHTYYISVRHSDGGWPTEWAADLVGAIPEGRPVAVHNSAFELPVLYGEWGAWVEGIVDTALLKSYADENTPLGLKFCSEHYFGYKQVSYEEVTQGRKMDELTAEQVFDYGCDDAICTAALYNRLRFTLEIEETLDAFEKCELPTLYWVAETFVRGVAVDWELLKRLEQEDAETYDRLHEELTEYLLSINWPGSEFEPAKDLTPATIKEIFLEVAGVKLDTRVRNLDKLATAIAEQGQPELAQAVLEGDLDTVNLIREGLFEASPDFSVSKTAHLCALLYDTWKLPIRFRTNPTDIMRAKGIWEGNPQADFAAFEHALKLDTVEGSEQHRALTVIREMKYCQTRQDLYYTPYPLYRHWRDGRLHPQMGQCRTATRRFASSAVNISQISKKGEGKKIRSIFRAPEGYVWVSSDMASQELSLVSHCSCDENLLSCFVGDQKKDPHSIMGAAIAKMQGSEFGDYELFVANKKDNPQVKALRNKGKAVGFSSLYGCRAAKLAKLLVIPVNEAEVALKAKEEAYPGLVQWAEDQAEAAKVRGYSLTLMGARRHLYNDLNSADKWIQLAAGRKSGNYQIQGSGCEQIKLALASMRNSGLFERFPTATIAWTVHDQADFLVSKQEAPGFIRGMHKCMTQSYGGMPFCIESEVQVGLSFGELTVVGTKPTEELVAKVIEESC